MDNIEYKSRRNSELREYHVILRVFLNYFNSTIINKVNNFETY